ncbi:MAG: peptidylprolyl isomerase [Myxococcota bacterium]|nr:peptidylprolyl isomerase [Myxococcota bacterium]
MSTRTNKFKVILLLMLFLNPGCKVDHNEKRADVERRQPDAEKNNAITDGPIGRLGDIKMGLTDYRTAISETIILRLWQTKKNAPLSALKSLPLRQKVLLRALETRVVRQKFSDLGLTRSTKMMEALLAKAALGLQPDHRLSESDRVAALSDLELLEAQIVARFNAPFAHVKRVAADLVEHRILADKMLDKLLDTGPQAAWTEEKTCLSAELYRVPRVPTALEIDKAIEELQPQMKTYYESNPRLFKTPARTFIRRFLLENTDATKDMVVKKRLQQFRQTVIDGGDMEVLVKEHGFPRDRRSGGRKAVSMSKRPDLHARSKGSITPIEQHPSGWVFYKIEGHGDAVNRPFDESRVQRELAAAVLRQENLLPNAKRIAGLLAYRLRGFKTSEQLGDAFLKENRIRRSETGQFCKTSRKHVPSIGLAPELVPTIFKLTMDQPVSNPLRIRQDLIVAKLLWKTSPTAKQWAAQKAAFTVQWRKREAPTVVRKWLHEYARQHRPWIDSKRLKALKLADLEWRPDTASEPR